MWAAAAVPCLLGLASFTFSTVSHAAEETSSKTLKIYILTGQSNMVGRDTGAANGQGLSPSTDIANVGCGTLPPPEHAADNAVPMWNYLTGGPSSATNEIALTDNLWKPLQAMGNEGSSGSYWGPEIGMARSLYNMGERDFAIIKVAQGGTGNSSWERHTDAGGNVVAGSSNNVYYNLYTSIANALQHLPEGYGSVEIAGIGYLQGESNSTAEGNAAAERLQQLVFDLKGDLKALGQAADIELNVDGLKLVIAEPSEQKSANVSAQTETVNQLKELAAGDGNAAFVDTRGLPIYKGDSYSVHYTSDGQIVVGERMADAFLTLGAAAMGEEASYIWNGGVSGSWNGADAWLQNGSSVAWPDATAVTVNEAVFNTSGATITIDALANVNKLTFNESTTLAGNGKQLTLINRAEIFVAGDQTATITAAWNATNAFSKEGEGTLTLNNADTNLLGIDVDVRAGTLSIVTTGGIGGDLSAGNNFTEGLGTWTIAPGAALAFDNTAAFTFNANLVGTGTIAVGAQRVTLGGDLSGFSGSARMTALNGSLFVTGNHSSTLNLARGLTLEASSTIGGTRGVRIARSLTATKDNLQFTIANSGGVTFADHFDLSRTRLTVSGSLLLGADLDLAAYVRGQSAKTTSSSGVILLKDNGSLSSDSGEARRINGVVAILGNMTVTLGSSTRPGALTTDLLQINGGSGNGQIVNILSDVATSRTVLGGNGHVFNVVDSAVLDVGKIWGTMNGDMTIAKNGYGKMIFRGFDTGAISGSAGTSGRNLAINAGVFELALDNGENVTWAQTISGAGLLEKSGDGLLTLNRNNTNSGGTLVSGGTLKAGHSGAFGSGKVTVNAGAAALDLSGKSVANAIEWHAEQASLVNAGNYLGSLVVYGSLRLDEHLGPVDTATGTAGASVSIQHGGQLTWALPAGTAAAETSSSTPGGYAVNAFSNEGTLTFDLSAFSTLEAGSYTLLSITGDTTSVADWENFWDTANKVKLITNDKLNANCNFS